MKINHREYNALIRLEPTGTLLGRCLPCVTCGILTWDRKLEHCVQQDPKHFLDQGLPDFTETNVREAVPQLSGFILTTMCTHCFEAAKAMAEDRG